ncbi:probable disease resistance protein At1g61300 [Telopea speciosissima]|uniref:probable disease resistance protein At1g61300 n=1 Tax=Telopea speciosissima TaxID=54955 RepID=UPI001CC74982|nr:probable disease resistance protein At1g61300 [Telopea speciosissima]
MGSWKRIKVQQLSEAESWGLFVEVVGEHVAADNIKCSVRKIVERCKGLPLAIVTVARAMTNQHGVGVWKNTAREIEQSTTELRGMIDEVLVPLKFSFDRLKNDMLRSLFLYYACFPENNNIGEYEILNYCIREGLADKLGSLKAARNKVEDLIESLKIANMLEDREYKGSARMHDMMRELAHWITSSEYLDSSPKFLIRTGKSVKEAPQPLEWVDTTTISLIDTIIKELPVLGETCRKLTTLLLRSNLRVLRLQRCASLRALPELGMLQLQILDLNFCEKLDQQILGSECVGSESNLRYLDLERTNVSIPVGMKDLELRHCRVMKQDNLLALNESQNLQLLSIVGCPGLTCVPIDVKETVMIMGCEELEKVFDEEDIYQGSSSIKELILERLPKLEKLYVGLPPLNCFGQLSWIHIQYCNRLKMVFTKGMPCLYNLETMLVSGCERMEVIIEAEEEIGEELEGKSNIDNGGVVISPFPKLMSLVLLDLPTLADLCSNHILPCIALL